MSPQRTEAEAMFREVVRALVTELSDTIVLIEAWIDEPDTIWIVFRRAEAPGITLGTGINVAVRPIADDLEESGYILATEVLEVGWIPTDGPPRFDSSGVQWMLPPRIPLLRD